MSKLDELKKASGAIAAESMGARRSSAPMHGASGTPTTPDKMQGVSRHKTASDIALDRIVRDPAQPREEFEPGALERLAKSLRTKGQLQPIRVRWDEAASRYVIVCGERRWRAAQMAGLPTVTAIVMDAPATPTELLALQLIENCVREDLRPIDAAKAFKALIDVNGWSTRELAEELAIDQSGVVRALALIGLPEAVQEAVEQGALAPSTAYEISKVDDPAAQQELAEEIVAKGLNRAEAVEKVRRVAGRARGKGASKAKAKGKPRLPKEMKHAGSTGVRLIALTSAKHSEEDVITALEEFVCRLRGETAQGTQNAA